MTDHSRPVLAPSAAHPIAIAPSTDETVVSVGERAVARTSNALVLSEAAYPPVFYVPLADVDPSVLRQSATTTYCPYKGVASYYSVELDDGSVHEDIAWTYRDPHSAVAEIAGRVAFYSTRARIGRATLQPDD